MNKSIDGFEKLEFDPMAIEKDPRSGRSIQGLEFARKFMFFLIPSFLGQKIERSVGLSLQKTNKPFSTAYLDGLRGLFSFFVFIRHFMLPWEPWLDKGFTQGDINPNASRSLWKLPFLRLVYAGPTVPIFFIASGFVLAYKPLRLIRKGDLDELGLVLMSSIFRRAFRLFIPPITTTCLVAIAVSLGFWNSPYDDMPGWVPRRPERLNNLLSQLSDWVHFVFNDLTHSWSWRTPRSVYDTHLWTIPIQFRASMIVFLVLMGLARAKPLVRTVALLALWMYTMLQDRWEMALFFAGMLLAERSLEKMLQGGVGPGLNALGAPLSPSIWKRCLWRSIFLLGMYLSSFPRARHAGPATPGFVWMSMLTDRYIYWQTHGATLMVWSLCEDRLLQRPLMCSLLQYLGRISFSLYLVHGPALHFFGYSLVAAFQEVVGYQLGIALALAIFTPIVIWIADVFWRAIDRPCAELVARFETFCVGMSA